jgi:FKBP-type peptidyl-prolyl cis-trans isomerase
MLKKSTSAFTSLLLVLALNVSPSLFAQDEEAAPKISISFADEAETPAPVTPAPAPAAPATDAEVKKPVPQMTPEEELFLIYGWFLFHRSQVDLLDLTKEEKLALLRGAAVAIDRRIIDGWEDRMPEVTALMDERWAPVYERMQRERKAQTVELFASLAKEENIKKTSTGLFYELVSEGTGKFPTSESTVAVEFVATLVDETVFETTEGRGGPIPITLANMVPGVREGLQYVREGGIVKLWVPASLGFGSEERPGIPADSALLFEFTLHEVVAADAAPAE